MRRVVLTLAVEYSATGLSLTALMECVHSDAAIPPGRQSFLLMLAIVFALPLLYFTGLKYTVQSSHSLLLCPQSFTFCIDPSSACNAFSISSASALSPSSLSYVST